MSRADQISGQNDLGTVNPKLAAQWHPTNNGALTPQQVLPGSKKKVWWQCEKGHEWQATVSDRTRGSGCPVCSGRMVLRGYNDLGTLEPQLSKEWHPTKNEDLLPEHVKPGSKKKVWWQCEKGHEWQAVVGQRSRGTGCPYCHSHRLRRLFPGENDLLSVNPEVASQWHPTKNADLKPNQIAANSNIAVWWQCEKGHEWQALVYHRNKGVGCPQCNSQRLRRLFPGENDLRTVNPEVAAQWHPTKNGDLTPDQVAANSNMTVWWQCDEGHEWRAIVFNRNRGNGCPICAELSRKKM